MIFQRRNFQRMAGLPFLLCVLCLALLGTGTNAVAQPILSNVNLSPSSLSPQSSGAVTVSATVASVNPVLSVYAQLYEDGQPYLFGNTKVIANLSNGGSGNFYTGTSFAGYPYYTNAGVSANTSTTQSHIWTAVVTATDVLFNQTTATTQSVIQPADIPIAITSVTLDRASLPATGSYLGVSATIVLGNSGLAPFSYQTLLAQLYEDGQPYNAYTYLVNGGNGNVYSRTFGDSGSTGGIPANSSTTQSHVWTVVVTAQDGVGNYTTATSQPITQPADVPPTITNISLSPTSLSSLANNITVTASIALGNSGLHFQLGGVPASAQLYEDGKPYLLSNGSNDIIELYDNYGTYVFSGTFINGQQGLYNLGTPPNPSTSQSHIWTVVVTATDTIGNSVTSSQSVTQPPDSPPVISNATISPTILLKNGDTLNVKATALPGNPQSAPVSGVTAELDRDGQPYLKNVALYTNSGAVYNGSFSIPANSDPFNGHSWTVILTATDTLGNSSQATVGPSVQLTGDQLTIAYASLNPAALPASGGTLIVDALGADPTNITGLVINIYKDGNFYATDSAGSGPGQLVNYEGRFQIAANPDTRSHNWSAVVTFTAGNGETVSRSLGPSVQAASPVATVTGRIALEGVGDFSAISPNAPPGTFHIAFRSPGAAAELYGADVALTPIGAGSPFGAFQVSGVPNGLYDVAIKGAKNLRVVLPNLSVSGNTIMPDAALPACDANNDNSVDSSDFGILIGAFNTDSRIAGSGYDPAADFNFDGIVDSTDFGLLIGEFNNQGAL